MERLRVFATVVVLGVGWILLAGAAWLLGRELTRLAGSDVAAFDGAMIATSLGIAVGGPVALGVSMWIQHRETAGQRRQREERRLELLRVAQVDLGIKRRQLLSEGSEGRQPRDHIVVPFFEPFLWTALTSSGRINVLDRPDDAETLYAVARAYDRIAATGYLERQAWETDNTPARRSKLPEILEQLGHQDGNTKECIDQALERLDAELGVPEMNRGPT